MCNEDEDDPSEKLQKGPKPKPKPKLKAKEERLEKFKRTLFIRQRNSLKCLVMLLMMNYTTLQKQGSTTNA
jgi:hypothetical protein